MSAIGKIYSLPLPGSDYFTVRDEYGNNHTVHRKELPKDADDGDDFAYHVSFFKAGGTTLVHESEEDDE